jgi:hypothetical protein
MERWFSCIAEVPGIEYQPAITIDRRALPGHDAKPNIDRYEFDGRVREYAMWPPGTSASPAKQWHTKPRPGETPAQTMLRQISETLELPGTASDYHFAIQTAHSELHQYARDEPWVLEEIEKLCWLNIRLISQYPETVMMPMEDIENEELAKLAAERRGDRRFVGVGAFHELIRLYEREGYLNEALKVAEIAQRFDHCIGKVEELKQRINILEAQADVT